METRIIEVLSDTFLQMVHLWPYLLITIPVSVAVEFFGFSKYIGKTLGKSPRLAILLAVAVGAFSPFCSCGVIPVIYSLLKGGIPLAPVMAFWVASPSMDPEMFFLSVGTLGWDLAVWRLASTLLLSLAAGYVTLVLWKRGWLGNKVLLETAAGNQPAKDRETGPCTRCGCNEVRPVYERLGREALRSSLMVGKFMLIAFVLTSAMNLLIPAGMVNHLSGSNGIWSVIAASLIGVPFYTSNLTALPMVGTLLNQGLEPAAALAFLIAGPVTTLPAMSAVWGLTGKRIFTLYISFALLGSMVAGLTYLAVSQF